MSQQSWAFRRDSCRNIEIVVIHNLRMFHRQTINDKIQNEDITDSLVITNIKEKMQENRLR